MTNTGTREALRQTFSQKSTYIYALAALVGLGAIGFGGESIEYSNDSFALPRNDALIFVGGSLVAAGAIGKLVARYQFWKGWVRAEKLSER